MGASHPDEQFHEVAPTCRPETGGRLVRQDEVRADGQGPGECDALLLIARQPIGAMLDPGTEAHVAEELGRPGCRDGRGDPGQLEWQGDVLEQRQPCEEAGVPEEEPDAEQPEAREGGRIGVAEIPPVPGDHSGARPSDEAQEEHGRCRAAGRQPGEEDDLAAPDVEGETRERAGRVAAATGRPGCFVQREDRSGFRHLG